MHAKGGERSSLAILQSAQSKNRNELPVEFVQWFKFVKWIEQWLRASSWLATERNRLAANVQVSCAQAPE